MNYLNMEACKGAYQEIVSIEERMWVVAREKSAIESEYGLDRADTEDCEWDWFFMNHPQVSARLRKLAKQWQAAVDAGVQDRTVLLVRHCSGYPIFVVGSNPKIMNRLVAVVNDGMILCNGNTGETTKVSKYQPLVKITQIHTGGVRF